ncbi:hypothetical protein GN956_G5504 [Arapaima gigas]
MRRAKFLCFFFLSARICRYAGRIGIYVYKSETAFFLPPEEDTKSKDLEKRAGLKLKSRNVNTDEFIETFSSDNPALVPTT